MATTKRDVAAELKKLAKERILVLDGAWGTMLHGAGLQPDDYRGERFASHHKDVAGDPDILNLTRPDLIRSVHDQYLAAGADITTTNTFTATSIGQADYGLEDAVYEMNVEGARIARESPGPRRFVAGSGGPATPRAPPGPGRFGAGSVGPLNIPLSLSPRVDGPGYRTQSFDQIVETYAEQMR